MHFKARLSTVFQATMLEQLYKLNGSKNVVSRLEMKNVQLSPRSRALKCRCSSRGNKQNLFVVAFLQPFPSFKHQVFSRSSLPLHLPPVTPWRSPLLLPPCHCSWAWHYSSFSQWSARPPEALSACARPIFCCRLPPLHLILRLSLSSVLTYLPLLSSAQPIYPSLNHQTVRQMKTWDPLKRASEAGELY